MRKPIIAANWKMNTTVTEGLTLAKDIRKGIESITNVEKILCPPFISLVPICETLKGSSIKLGAQDIFYEEKGAFTGEISASMLKGICEFVIVGHSERRRLFNVTGEVANKKMKAAVEGELKPILCVGESLNDNEAGKAEKVVTRQLRTALRDVKADGIVVAYEPVWAIGTGKAATPAQAGSTIALIRKSLSSIYGEAIADDIQILYGGSVNPGNAADFMREKDIDGALVGGASLRASDFIAIVKKTAEVKGGG